MRRFEHPGGRRWRGDFRGLGQHWNKFRMNKTYTFSIPSILASRVAIFGSGDTAAAMIASMMDASMFEYG